MHAELSSLDGTFIDRLGIKILELSAERVVGTMPVAGDAAGPARTGASCVLAETLGWSGASVHGGTGRDAAGIESTATHHRAAADGEVTGVATRVHGGRTLVTYEIEITDGLGRRVCTARTTYLLRDRPASGPPQPGGGHGHIARDSSDQSDQSDGGGAAHP